MSSFPRARVLAGLLLVAALTTGCGRAREAGEEVAFRTEDGFRLSGRIFGTGSKGVVLAHPGPGDQSWWFGFARDLAGSGYLALAFDFRGYGRSQGTRDVAVMDRDVRGAVAFLRGRGASSVALIGAGMGGTASIVAAASSRVEGVVTLSAPVSFRGLDASGPVQRVAVPKLFVAAKDDASAADAAESLFLSAADPRDLRILAGGRHGTALLSGRRGSEVERLLTAFLASEAR